MQSAPLESVAVAEPQVIVAASVGLVVTFGVAGACWAMLLRPLIRVSVLIPLVARTFWGTPRLNGAQRDAKALADLPLREAA